MTLFLVGALFGSCVTLFSLSLITSSITSSVLGNIKNN